MSDTKYFYEVPVMGKTAIVLTVEGMAVFLEKNGWKFEVTEDGGVYAFVAREEEFNLDFFLSMTTQEMEAWFQKTRRRGLWKDPQYQKALFKATLIRLSVAKMNHEGLVRIPSTDAI